MHTFKILSVLDQTKNKWNILKSKSQVKFESAFKRIFTKTHATFQKVTNFRRAREPDNNLTQPWWRGRDRTSWSPRTGSDSSRRRATRWGRRSRGCRRGFRFCSSWLKFVQKVFEEPVRSRCQKHAHIFVQYFNISIYYKIIPNLIINPYYAPVGTKEQSFEYFGRRFNCWGSCCDSVGIAIASNTRGLHFKSSHRQFSFTDRVQMITFDQTKNKNILIGNQSLYRLLVIGFLFTMEMKKLKNNFGADICWSHSNENINAH